METKILGRRQRTLIRRRFALWYLCAMVLALVAALVFAATSVDAQSTNDDGARVVAVSQAVAALESYETDNGTYAVAGAGVNGSGTGWYQFGGNGYPASIVSVLEAGGHYDGETVLVDPADTNAGHSPNDFRVHLCEGRAGVFAISNGIEPTAEDATWWANNNCPTYQINTLNHTYFQLTDTTAVDWSLEIESIDLSPGASGTVAVTMDPGSTPVVAVQLVVTYDPALITVTDCAATACNPSNPGAVNMTRFRADGAWTSSFEVGTITFTANSAQPATLTVEPVEILDFDLQPVPLDGTIITGGANLLVAASFNSAMPVYANLFLAAAQVQPTQRQLTGDVNCDGTRSIADAVIIAQYLSSLRENTSCTPFDPSGIHLDAADMNFDGQYSIADAVIVAQCLVGLFRSACQADLDSYEPTGSGTLFLDKIDDDLSGVTVNGDGEFFAVVNGVDEVHQLTNSGTSWDSTIVTGHEMIGGPDVEGITWIKDDLYAVTSEGVIIGQGTIEASAIQIVSIQDGVLNTVSAVEVFDEITPSDNKGLEGIAYAAGESSDDEWVFYAVKELPATVYRITYNVLEETAMITDSAELPGPGDAAGIAIPRQSPTRLYVVTESPDGFVTQYDVPAAGLSQISPGPVLALDTMTQPEGITISGTSLIVVGENNEVTEFVPKNPSTNGGFV